jgi:hypothetical protein
MSTNTGTGMVGLKDIDGKTYWYALPGTGHRVIETPEGWQVVAQLDGKRTWFLIPRP